LSTKRLSLSALKQFCGGNQRDWNLSSIERIRASERQRGSGESLNLPYPSFGDRQ
jgi:hypothetical protein